MIKVVSFDIGGTLLKSKSNDMYSNKTLAKLINRDYNIVAYAYKNVFQKQKGSFDELVDTFCKQINYSRDKKLDDFFHHKFASSEGIILPKDIEVIKKLKNKGYKVILLSNSCSLFKNNLNSELLSLVDHVFYSYNLGYTKENNEIYRIVEEKIGNSPPEILHIGDTLISDYLKPKENGWQTLYYGNNSDNHINCISNLNEIFKYLEGDYGRH